MSLKESETKNHPEYAYLSLLEEILDNGVLGTDEGTGAQDYSVFGRQIRFDLSKGFPLLTTKKVYWKGVLHELYWFFSGQTNIKYLVDNDVHIWDDYPYKIYKEKNNGSEMLSKEDFIKKITQDDDFAKEHGDLPRIYGEMWRKWPTRHGGTIDQLQWIVDELRADPYARNTIVNTWNPEYLYAMARSEDASRFPICHNMFQVSLKGGKLSLQLYQRSADMFLGVPFNIASYALLAVVLAKVLNVEPGEFIHTFGDAHIYSNHIDQARKQIKREPMPFPTVSISDKVKELSDFRPEHVLLENYKSHKRLKGDLTVAGGVKERDLEL